MRAIPRWSLALVLLPMAACSQPQPSVQAQAMATALTPALSSQDQNFIQSAGASDLFEIQSSQLALQKTRDPAVRRFADRMIHDHNQTTQRLNSIVSAKGLTPAPALKAQQQSMIDQLGRANGRSFIRDYRMNQIQGHQQAIQAFQDEANNGYDADIKGFAQQTLPLLRQHLTMAQGLP